MTKSNKQVIIDFIVSCLKNGEQRGKVLAKTVKKWQMSDRAFDRHLKIAKQQHTDQQQAINAELAEVDKQAAIEARKKAIMTADERKELLTKIAKGEIKVKRPFVIGGKIVQYPVEPDHSDIIKALSELSKMEGDYAETSIKLKGDKENPLYQKQSIIINGKEIEF